MEQVQEINILENASWIDKRSREFVHAILAKLSFGQLCITEGSEQFTFPDSAYTANLKAKIHVHDITMYRDFIKSGSIGAAEAFIAGKWTSPNLTNVIRLFKKAR